MLTIERKAREMAEEARQPITETELFAWEDFTKRRRTYVKRVGDLEIVYRERPDKMYEFTCVRRAEK